MVKHVRINAMGRVVDGDRRVHVAKAGPAVPADPPHPADPGGPDQVKWRSGGGGPWTIRFSYDEGSPFTGPGPFSVPGPPAVVAPGAGGTYKYDVLDSSGDVKDDPDVIVD